MSLRNFALCGQLSTTVKYTNLAFVDLCSELSGRAFQDGDWAPEAERYADAREEDDGGRDDVHRKEKEQEVDGPNNIDAIINGLATDFAVCIWSHWQDGGLL